MGLKESSLAGISPKTFGDEERNAMSRFVDAAMRQIGIPGTAIAVVQNGQTVYAEGFGVCRADGEERVTADTRFMIGSATKASDHYDDGQAGGSEAFHLVDSGDRSVAGFRSSGRRRHSPSGDAAHGVRLHGHAQTDLDLIFRFRYVRPEDRIAEMRQMSPTTGFGETFQYSNYLVAAGGYAAAHSYAQDLSLQDAYDRAMRELVFEPLGMSRTSILCMDSPSDAAPHGRDLDGIAVPIDPVLENFADAVAPAGSVWSSVLDMAQYLKCEMRDGSNDGGEQIISPEICWRAVVPPSKSTGK